MSISSHSILNTFFEALLKRRANAIGPDSQGVRRNSQFLRERFSFLDLLPAIGLIVAQNQLAVFVAQLPHALFKTVVLDFHAFRVSGGLRRRLRSLPP